MIQADVLLVKTLCILPVWQTEEQLGITDLPGHYLLILLNRFSEKFGIKRSSALDVFDEDGDVIDEREFHALLY